MVNGRARGNTPLTLPNLAPGRYTVVFRRNGYEQERRRVTLSTSSPETTLAVSLQPTPGRKPAAPPASSETRAGAAQTARLEVVSRPAGARVIIDGREAGTTPLTAPALAAGQHTIRIELDGYRPWSTTVRAAGAPLRVAASLERGPSR